MTMTTENKLRAERAGPSTNPVDVLVSSKRAHGHAATWIDCSA